MTRPDLYTILRADARRWPDHTDYWRFGPVLASLAVPPMREHGTGFEALVMVHMRAQRAALTSGGIVVL